MCKIQCDNCLSYNCLNNISPEYEAFRCWNCQQTSFLSYEDLLRYQIRTNDASQSNDIVESLALIIDGDINESR